jgi:hypothetical protein
MICMESTVLEYKRHLDHSIRRMHQVKGRLGHRLGPYKDSRAIASEVVAVSPLRLLQSGWTV